MKQPKLAVKQVERGNVYSTKLNEKNSKVYVQISTLSMID